MTSEEIVETLKRWAIEDTAEFYSDVVDEEVSDDDLEDYIASSLNTILDGFKTSVLEYLPDMLDAIREELKRE